MGTGMEGESTGRNDGVLARVPDSSQKAKLKKVLKSVVLAAQISAAQELRATRRVTICLCWISWFFGSSFQLF